MLLRRADDAIEAGVFFLQKEKYLKLPWVWVVGLPLHPWHDAMLIRMSEACGGFVKVDEDRIVGKHFHLVKIKVRVNEGATLE